MNRRASTIGILIIFVLVAHTLAACFPSATAYQGQSSIDTSVVPLLAKPVPQRSGPSSGPSEDRRTGPTQAPVQVTATQPSDGSTNVDPSTQILVIFNRPIVPLTSIDEQEQLPQPLAIEPATSGVGEWINTSVYSFQPDKTLLGSAEYSVTIEELNSFSGERLAESHTFTFTTAAPTVVAVEPTGNRVAPDAASSVQFSQPMDPNTTGQAFHLFREEGQNLEIVEGETSWDEARQTLYFTPTRSLEFGQSYSVSVSQDATPAGGSGALREPFSSSFTVAPYPDIVNVTPVDGATGVPPETSVVIRFNTHVSRTQVIDQVSVSPVLSTTSVYSYYSPYNDELMLSWYKEPNTAYTVTVGGEIEDDYGNTLGEDRSFTFVTGNYAPFVNLELDRFAHFTAGQETRVSMLHRNVDSVTVDLYTLPQRELLRLSGSDQWNVWQDYTVPNPNANRIWRREYDTSGSPNVTVRQIITVTDTSGDPLPPGTYFLTTDSPELDSTDTPSSGDAALVISRANLVMKKSENGSSLAWLTDLMTGEPVAGTEVRFFMDGQEVGEQVTDADGIAMLELAMPDERSWAPVVALSGSAGSHDFAVTSSDWNDGIAPWDFDLASGWGGEPVQSYFYTDRPIYRPGDTVHWKGIIRTLVNDEYSLPDEELTVRITARDDMGNVVTEEQTSPNDLGTVHGDILLSEEAGTGFYFLEAQLGEGDKAVYSGVGFQVAEYRKPEFEVSVESQQPEYVQGDTVRMDVNATYFSGGPLAGVPVTWRLIAEPYTFSWSDEEGRRFAFSPFDPDSAVYDPYRGAYSLGVINEGNGETDPDGNFSFELPADIGQALQSQNWAFDVTVQSGTNQFVTGRTTVPIHRAEYYIGLAPQRYVSTVGTEALVDLVTLTPEFEPYPGAELDVVVYDFNWNSVSERNADGSYRWETSVERTPIFTTTQTADRSGEALLSWTPRQAGQYQIVVSGTDDGGNPTSSAVFLWVSASDSDDYVAWPMQNNDRIEIVADKQSYAPGETAHILVPSPFQGPVRALLTTERAGVISAEVLDLTSNSEMLEIPITDIHIPNVFVNVLLVKGIDESNPHPALRAGYVMLSVDTEEVELAVDINASGEQVRPGSLVTYTVQVYDHTGNPQANAEVSVALVDEAILALSGGEGESLLDAFYRQRPLGVATGASLIINQDRISEQLSEGAKGGGGGGGGMLEVRSDFRDLAYWSADLRTDEGGLIQFQVALPDSLTTWRLIIKAVTEDTRVGEANAETVATKELQIRTLTPRFVTAGDRPWLGAQVINTSGFTVTGVLTYTVGGATFADGDTEGFTYTLGPGEETAKSWLTEVSTSVDELSILAVGSASNVEDASQTMNDGVSLSLPVKRYEVPETVASSGTVPPGGTVEQIVLLEEVTDQGSLNVRVEPNLAGGMLEGLTYLRHYPYECNEQVVSRFLPNLVTVRALHALEINDPELESQLAYQLGIGVQRLVTRQNPDGGWGYWPGEESSPFITAYVLWGLSLADEQGYSTPSMVREEAIGYLDSQFEAPQAAAGEAATMAAWRLNEMAFMHYVLSELDAGDPGRASTLFDVRESLAIYGKAYLAMALHNMANQDEPDPRIETLLDDIVGSALLSATGLHWEESSVDFWTLNTDTRTTSIVLSALTQMRPEQPLLPQVVRWLMVTREAGRWSTTQENAWAIIGLTDWLVASGELEGDYDWSVALNGEQVLSGSTEPGAIAPPADLSVPVALLLRDAANELAFDRSGETAQLYYTTHLQYFLDATAIDSRDHGIVIGRRFSLADKGSAQSVSSAEVGDVVSVTVTIVAPNDLHHVLLEVPIPAGMEPIDPNLATTERRFSEPSMTSTDDRETSHGWWRNWVPTYTDYRDDKVALFATYLPAGTYEYTFNARAGLPGEYRVLPAYAEMMYFNEVWGRSEGSLFSVTD